jgi:hypothetical protein
MQTVLPRLFVLAALVISLFVAWVIYTQVEVIRLNVGRWKALGGPETAPPLASEVAQEAAPAESTSPPAEE